MKANIAASTRPEPAPRSAKVGLVPFLFAVAQAEELSGVVLVHLLGDLGIGPAAARGQLARMRAAGQLAVSRNGRRAVYRLHGPFAATFRKLRRHGPEPTPTWPGYFHALLYQVPEAQRPYRDRLRRVAQLVGYGLMQQGVLIATRDRTGELSTVLAEAPPDSRIQPATIGVPVADAVTIARTAWNLDAVQDAFRGHIATLTEELRGHRAPPANAATLARMAHLLNAPFVDLIRDPALPAALLPPDWERPYLDHLMAEVRQRYVPPSTEYVRQVIATIQGP